jgi:NADH:ubiquinone oxidoreductase subunit K
LLIDFILKISFLNVYLILSSSLFLIGVSCFLIKNNFLMYLISLFRVIVFSS